MLLTVLFTLTVLIAGLPDRRWVGQARDLSMPSFGPFVARHRRTVLVTAALITVPLAWGLTRLHVDARVERLRPGGPGLALESHITERFGLPTDVYLLMSRGPQLEPLLASHEDLAARLDAQPLPVSHVGAEVLLPSAGAQQRRRDALAAVTSTTTGVADAVDAAGDAEGFVPGTFAPFRDRLPRVLDVGQSLTLDELSARGLGDLVGRFVRRVDDEYVVVTYATARDAAGLAVLRDVVSAHPDVVLTGLPLVNEALAARLPRELGLGLGFGAALVVALIWLEFRAMRPTLLAMLPTICGIIWGLGMLGWAGVVLDLFSVFAVLMFLGIGVDYGIHLLHPTLGAHGLDMSEALSLVGPALLLAGATTVVGFGTLAWSAYAPLQSLGLVSVATITAALIASLLVVPAVVLTREDAA